MLGVTDDFTGFKGEVGSLKQSCDLTHKGKYELDEPIVKSESDGFPTNLDNHYPF
jgi:hypothetical protein